MRNSRRIAVYTFLFLMIVILSDKALGQNPTNGFLIINVYESYSDKRYNLIIVTENENKLEEIPLQDYKNLESNQIELNKVLTKYKNAGYSLNGITRGAVGATSIMVTTYVFEKK
jgi:hypothetical protein